MINGNNALKIDFKKAPFKGVFLKIAKRKGRHHHSIRRSYNLGVTDIVVEVNKEIQNRMKLVDDSNKQTAKILKLK